MKKTIVLLLAVILVLGLTACSDNSKEEKTKIGVIVYNVADDEVISFREYLKGYIEKTFEMVEFIYSESIRSQEEEMAFIQEACNMGVKGFMSFRTFDLKKEVELCGKNGAYYMLASGTVSDEEFDSVADNPWFLGMFGPGEEEEFEAGVNMAKAFAASGSGDRYFLLSGGGSAGNEMHYLRTLGMLTGLSEHYGVAFDNPLEDLACAEQTTVVSAGKLSVTIVPGYMSNAEALAKATNVYTMGAFDAVLAAMSVGDFISSVHSAKFGMVDSYTATNRQLFESGILDYMAGKYAASVGPAFALMFNALNGYAEDFRDNGKAVKVAQGFWVSESAEDYAEKYALATSATMNAYNFADLSNVCKAFNKNATLSDLVALAKANSYEDVLVRRS